MDIFKLVGSIFVDTDEANKSLSKTGDKAEETSGKLGKIAGTAGKVALGVGAAAAAVGGAMIASAKETAANMDVVDKASQRMKIGAESYQELAHAAELSGVEMSTLEKAAKKLEGTDLNLDDALAQIYELGTAEERSAKAAELFGDTVAYNMTPLLNASAEDMEAMKQEARDLGLVMSEDTVKAGAEMNDTFTKVQESFSAVTNQLGAAVMPIVNELLNWVLENMPVIQEYVGQAIDFIVNLIEELTPIIKDLMPVIQEVFSFIGQLWETSLKPILSGILTFIKGVFTGDWKMAFEGLGNIVKGVFEGLVSIIKVPLNAIIGMVNGFINGINTLKIPDWIPLVGGKKVNIPNIPYLAKGGEIVGSGAAIVGESGAELVSLPAGATVTPLNANNNELMQTMNAILERLDSQPEDIYNAMTAALNGYTIDWNDKNLGRLVKQYA